RAARRPDGPLPVVSAGLLGAGSSPAEVAARPVPDGRRGEAVRTHRRARRHRREPPREGAQRLRHPGHQGARADSRRLAPLLDPRRRYPRRRPRRGRASPRPQPAEARRSGGAAAPAGRDRRRRARASPRTAPRRAGGVQGVLLGALRHRAPLPRASVPAACARDDHRGVPARYGARRPARGGAPAGAARRRLVLGVLRVVALVLLVAALARPQAGTAATKVHREGVDVALAVDVSGSMLSEDFTLPSGRASRLDAVKAVVREFVAARPEDRVGLVLFAARPYTQCPLTLDHGWLLQNLDRAKIGMIEDGTAIGSGLATAV